MGLFDRKTCDICGEKIGLMGNKKLSDGNLCKDCAAKLSPFFTERKESSVEDIRAQLEYRETNKERVAAFHTTAAYGTGTMIYLDQDQRQLMVTSAKSILEANPDVISFSDITGCNVNVEESRSEVLYRSSDGRTCSYSPAQYTTHYDFYVNILVNNPYFNQIRVKLNSGSVDIDPQFTVIRDPNLTRPGFQQPVMNANRPVTGTRPMTGSIRPQMPPRPGQPTVNRPMTGSVRPQTPPRVGQSAPAAAAPKPALLSPSVSSRPASDPTSYPEYAQYMRMAEEVRAALSSSREEAREAAAPHTPVICPYCGATTVPDERGCCEYCGSPLVG